jgi:hypothetical protein
MKRKFRVGLKIKFKNPNGIEVFVRKALMSWKSSKKEHSGIINTLYLIKFRDFYYIYFRGYACPISPYFLIKETFYEEKN